MRPEQHTVRPEQYTVVCTYCGWELRDGAAEGLLSPVEQLRVLDNLAEQLDQHVKSVHAEQLAKLQEGTRLIFEGLPEWWDCHDLAWALASIVGEGQARVEDSEPEFAENLELLLNTLNSWRLSEL
jgi:hypothetical protein